MSLCDSVMHEEAALPKWMSSMISLSPPSLSIPRSLIEFVSQSLTSGLLRVELEKELTLVLFFFAFSTDNLWKSEMTYTMR